VDWDALAAVAGAVAVALAAWQLWRIRADAFDTRAAEIASVAIVTTLVERPTKASNRDGSGVWVYEFSVHNPGRLPISDVSATITFPCAVQREHYDGTLETSARTLHLRTPVIAQGGIHTRRRHLLIAEDNRSCLDSMLAEVTFRTPDAGAHTTHWPPAPAKGSSSIRRRLADTRR